ncbi:MAG: TIGR00730 family Rossman fold protein [Anaerolineaceae bacterium]
MLTIKSVCVFCGSADRLNPEYIHSAREMGGLLAAERITMIFGGGKTGLMGAVAEGCLTAGGKVIGVITPELDIPALAFSDGFEKDVMPDLETRKTRMRDLADEFIILPGGFGTFDEFFSTLTLAQLGLISKPIGLLNTRSYFDPLMAMLQHALVEKFIYPEHLELIQIEHEPVDLLNALRSYRPPADLPRWIERE